MQGRLARLGVLLSLCGLVAGAGVPAAASSLSQGALVRGTPSVTWPGRTSGNWSGYVADARSGFNVTYAASYWIVPAVQAVKGFSSSWVGVDGDGNSNLIQTGTEQDFDGHSFIYRAWWEILPAAETIIPSMVIHPGDKMFGSVKDVSGTSWLITLKDITRNESFSIKRTYHGAGKSIEWVQEAPTLGGIETLAHYKTTEFSTLTQATNFHAPSAMQLAFPGMAMAMTQNGQIVSIPSNPNAAGNAFRVAYGNVQPPAP